MKIKDIYRNEKPCFVSILTAILCAAITLLTSLVPSTYTALAYCYPLRYPWQAVSGIFVHGSPNMDLAGTIGHLGFNLLLVLPFGILIEKIIGSKKFFLFSGAMWIVNALTFYLIAICNTPAGEHSYGAGISGIAFSYGIVGLYALYQLFRRDKKAVFKQVSFYLLLNIVLIMLIMINPVVAGVSSMIMHMVAVAGGVVFLMVGRGDMRDYLAA